MTPSATSDMWLKPHFVDELIPCSESVFSTCLLNYKLSQKKVNEHLKLNSTP